MLEFKVGVCDITVELNTPDILKTGGLVKEPLNGYDLVVSHEGKVVKIWTNVYAKSQEDIVYKNYRFGTAEKIARRYTVLNKALNMANHNLMCYSTNLLMDTPKPEYADKWHEALEESKVLEEMIKELPHTTYMPPKGEE